MTQILLLALMVYAAAGLVLSLVVHLLSFGGIQVGGDALYSALNVGIFPLWFPVMWISVKITNGMPVQNSWGQNWGQNSWGPVNSRSYLKLLFSGCPAWMQYMTYGFFIYAFANFAMFSIFAPSGKPVAGSLPADVWHNFSGHLMAFYSAGLATVTTAYRRGLANLSPRCPNGHAIVYGDKFCPVCGVRIDERQN